MRNLLQDVRFGLRVLSSSPGFASVAVLTLGLGIACTTTVFSWIDTVLLHPYPGTTNSSELASLEMITASAPNGGTSVSWPDYCDYRSRLKTLSGLAVRRQSAFTLGDGQPARLAWGELVSANYFQVMGVRARLGRTFTPEESVDAPGAPAVVVISERLWRSYFHSDPAVAGKTVRVNRHSLTIVGVMPAQFRGGSPILPFDLWAPVTMGPELGLLQAETFTERGERGMLNTLCRVRTGVPIEQARAEVTALANNLASEYPKTNRGVGATVLSNWEEHNGINEYLREPLSILLAISFVVLLIVCANVANLLLTRAVGRQREFGIRCALGATRWRVAAQVLMETLVLASLGAFAGVLMLLWMEGSLVAMAPDVGFPLSTPEPLNGRILAYTALTCVAAAVIAGVSPALFVFRANLNEVLKEGSRSDTAGAASRRTRSLLVIAEVALATVALVGAGLFLRSFRNVRAVHPGFQAEHVLFGRFFIETSGYSSVQIEQFAEHLKARLLSMNGVESVTYTDFVPLSSTGGPYNYVQVEGYTPPPEETPAVNRTLSSPDYFATMQIPLLEGRDFTSEDKLGAEPVIIVNQTFARRFFHGEDPIGRRVHAAGQWSRVVGLARDSKYYSPAEAASPHFYHPFLQFYEASPELFFFVRTTGRPEQAIPLLRRAVVETDPNASAFHAVPLTEYTGLASFGQKVAASLMSALGLVCFLLAALGLYSVMSYSITQRIPEISIRLALGATPGTVIAMVVRQGIMLALLGIVTGVAVAIVAARMVSTMLFAVNPADPATFVLVALFLLATALAATWLPAFRATRIDSLSALRR